MARCFSLVTGYIRVPLGSPRTRPNSPISPTGRTKLAHSRAACDRSFPSVTFGVGSGAARMGGTAPTVVRVSDTWQVEPSGPLRGDIQVRGSKNAVTKHMVAAMLGDGPSTIRNAPEVGDVDITAAMLEAIGYQVSRSGGDVTVAPNGPVPASTVPASTVPAASTVKPRVPEAFTGLNRIPILMIGP